MTSIDLDYRPQAYFGDLPQRERLLSTINGEARRRTVRRLLDSGTGNALRGPLVANRLPDALRLAAGAIHPDLMGGEYLPGLRDDEVEIARISLASTTLDQISIRAWRVGGRIRYVIRDEYETDYAVKPRSSARPLSLRELIRLIDHAEDGGLVLAPLQDNLDCGASYDDLCGFVSVSSVFYPQLVRWYDALIERWFEENAARIPAPLEEADA